MNLDTAKTEIARLIEELDVGRREQNRLQSNLTAAGGLVVDLKGQPNRANLLVDRLSELKGVDEPHRRSGCTGSFRRGAGQGRG